MDDLEAMARMATAQLRALVTPPRHCRHCGVELKDRPGPGRPAVWCEAHRTAIGRRPRRRVCVGCGVSLDGRRRQTGSRGRGLVRNPMHQIVRDDRDAIRLLTRELGLSPAARASLRVPPGAEAPDIDAALGPPPRLRVVGDA